MHLAYAEASVMLIECLMLTLAEKGVVERQALIDAVETAIETKQHQVKEGTHPQLASIAAGVLSRIASSLGAGAQRDSGGG
jgi:hypothetical protein